ncbi:MAG TPA: SRPBCC family protein [Solirubrobacter sp.]|nr:SRPBCC family protein [Solirubrobacter sp.]
MRIAIRAPAARIFALAADVEQWPRILPHYRYVRRLAAANGERRFAMGASRGPIPVRWETTQRPLPDRGVIEFTHTGGVTRGMAVAWRLVERGDGITDVSIEHELHLAWPLIGRFAAERVIGPQFIDAIAGRTLRRIKLLAERKP